MLSSTFREHPGSVFIRRRSVERLTVCAAGRGENGTPSIGVWWIDLAGEPQAGWVFGARDAYADPEAAGRLVTAAALGRIVERTPGTTLPLLSRLGLARMTAARMPEPLRIDDLLRLAPLPIAGPGRTPEAGPNELVAGLLSTCRLIAAVGRAWRDEVIASGGPSGRPSPIQRWIERSAERSW